MLNILSFDNDIIENNENEVLCFPLLLKKNLLKVMFISMCLCFIFSTLI
jgi:hypothetical protein